METIGTGHWIFALTGTIIYIGYCLWGYKKEYAFYKNFNFQIISTMIYMGLILLFLVLVS